MPSMIKTCLFCGKEFSTQYRHQIYCSRLCKRRAYNRDRNSNYVPVAQVKRACVICGNEFAPKRSNQLCCSGPCKKALQRRRNSAYYLSHKSLSAKTYEPRACKLCGKPFTPSAGKQIFCSPACQKKFHHLNDKKPAKPVKNYGFVTCPQCGKEFRLSHGNRVYCSDACRLASKRRNRQPVKPKKPGLTKSCAFCGKAFTSYQRTAKFCSRQCYLNSLSKAAKLDSVPAADFDQEISRLAPAFASKSKSSLDKWIDEARQCGMSYGKYRAAREQLGLSFEQLLNR